MVSIANLSGVATSMMKPRSKLVAFLELLPVLNHTHSYRFKCSVEVDEGYEMKVATKVGHRFGPPKYILSPAWFYILLEFVLS